MFIKICGMTSVSAVIAAVECGVDAIGLVFAPSSRRVTPQQAARLCEQAPPGLLRIAVTHHPEQSLVDEICEVLAPDYLQTDVEDLAGLHLAPGVQLLPVLRHGVPEPRQLPPRFLFEGSVSGSGNVVDWERAGELARRAELVLAGGLTPANVAAAIARVRPYGVDVSSGVESAPGVKDARRIAQFVTAVRGAGHESQREKS
jgi:phosphoribosylanthranilate isomerase